MRCREVTVGGTCHTSSRGTPRAADMRPGENCGALVTTPAAPARGPRGPTRITILDDHLLFAESLEIAFTLEGYDVRRVAFSESSGSLRATGAAIARQRPHIALLDLDLGRMGSSLELIAPLTEAGVAVVVVTGAVDEESWGQCLYLGARTVLLKSQPLSEILSTVRRVRLGLEVMPATERATLIRRWQTRHVELSSLRRRLARLTPREREVLGHLTQGQTVHEIAVLGEVSEATVRTQVKSILAKLEVSSQIAAVGIAHQVGWRSPTS